MRRSIALSLITTIVALLLLPTISLAAISLSVSPTSAPADTSTGFTFQTQAAIAGGTAQFGIFNDYNNNGTIDADEWPIVNMTVIDNGQ